MPATLLRTQLENGAVMTRAEFHRLYSESADLEHVELIEGVVYLPSPVKIPDHARPQAIAIEWLVAYALGRIGIEWCPPGTVLLDDQNEPEPDAMLYRLRPGRFEDGYLLGAPELAVEIANSSVSRDLHQKKRAYERNGVLEYIVWRVQDAAIDWFELRDGAYVRREPDDAGIIESTVFPGLRMDVAAMLADERNRALATLGG